MRFENKFIDLKYLEEKNGIMRGNELHPCSICGRLTPFIEINYEGYFCSNECVAKMDSKSYPLIVEDKF